MSTGLFEDELSIKTCLTKNLSWWTMLILYSVNGGLILH